MILCIDAGHGGSDQGANYGGYIEKELNLVVARRVYELLKDKVDVDITREKDITLEPKKRTGLIKDKYKYCLSIHFNAANGKGSGIETIHAINSTKGKKLAQIIADKLSKSINLSIRRVFSRKRSGSNTNYYYMHRETGSTTTVIVECCFIDNEADIDRLNVEKISEAIAEGFIEFYNQDKEEEAKPQEVEDEVEYMTLRKGMKGNEVKVLQVKLNQLGYSTNGIDGIFGNGTYNAVVKFQKNCRLVADGIVGRKTWDVLNSTKEKDYQVLKYDKQTTIVKFAKNKLDEIDVIKPEGYGKTVKQVWNALKRKPDLLMNGALFNMANGEELTKIVDDYIRKGNWEYYANYCLVSKDGKDVEFRPLDANEKPKEAIGLVPSLVKDGNKDIDTKGLDYSFVKGKHPRLAIGQDNKYFYIIIVHGRRWWLNHKGCTIDELADICMNFDMTEAGNLDGGGSIAVMNKFGKFINSILGNRKVDNLIAIYFK